MILDIDIYIEFKFNKKLSNLSANEFIKNILVNKLNIKNLVVGKILNLEKIDREILNY